MIAKKKESFLVNKKRIEELPLDREDIKEYSKIYRYFPNFAETNL